MDTFDILIIRACKSKKPLIRLKFLLKRMYLSDDYGIMIHVLSKTCDRYKLFDGIDEYIHVFHSTFTTFGKDNDNLSRNDIQFIEVNTLISKIRLSKIDKFPGYIPPAKFRK